MNDRPASPSCVDRVGRAHRSASRMRGAPSAGRERPCPGRVRRGLDWGARRALVWLSAGLLTLAAAGCLKRELKPLNPCLVSGVVETIQVLNIDKVDLLFMVDNSNSMIDEQQNLAAQFPKLVQVLTTGQLVPGRPTEDFPPVKDLHLGVISSDMGLVGINNIPGCGTPPFGDDGILIAETRNPMGKTGCQPRYQPGFIQYKENQQQPMQVAHDFGCLAVLHTGGCGFEQQLEAVLKALTPPSVGPKFVADAQGNGALGHGGTTGDPNPGQNAGFLRPDSLLTVIMVTDEEDCSSHNLEHFMLEQDLPPNSSVRANTPAAHLKDMNLRCFFNKQNLYPINRYVDGLKALRPGLENLVIFAAITGVPPNLVDAAAKAQHNNLLTPQDRQRYYEQILNHPSMTETIDPSSTQVVQLAPSCRHRDSNAQPARRIVEVAREFGRNGVVESICSDDFGPALDAVIKVISDVLKGVCLPRRLTRDADGLVDCDVVWELPPPVAGLPPGTPTKCDDEPYLTVPPPGRAAVTDRGNARCVVTQVPILGNQPPPPNALGWYYDNFSLDLGMTCPDTPQRVAFTDTITPPTGATVRLECLSEVQGLSAAIATHGVNLGEACQSTPDVICGAPNLPDPSFCCHQSSAVWAVSCNSDASCPAGWACDRRDQTVLSAGGPICVNPTCGE